MSRWGEQQSYKFVTLYKEAECLWNFFDPCYRNRDMRLDAFKHIVEEMNIAGFTLDDVAKKIRSFRSTYNQELQKIKNSEKSGAGTGELYKPSLKWFDDMDYIMKNSNIQVQERPRYTNMVRKLLF